MSWDGLEVYQLPAWVASRTLRGERVLMSREEMGTYSEGMLRVLGGIERNQWVEVRMMGT